MRRILGPAVVVLALVLAVISLTVSGFTLYGLLRARQASLSAVAEARAALSNLNDYTIETTIPFSNTFPIQTEVPLEQEFAIPVQATIPFSTVVEVPIMLPVLGRYELSIPVSTEMPLDIEVIVPISQVVEVETVVAVDTTVPVRVEVAQLGLGDLLEQIDATLAEMEQGLRWPMRSGKP